MRIHQILSDVPIILSNEEHRFVESHQPDILLSSLFDRDQVIARNLVRKGVYEISKDNRRLLLRHVDNQKI